MFTVYDKNMNLVPFPEGVKPLDIFISSIQKERITEAVEGVHGLVNKGFTYSGRDVQLELLVNAQDTKDYRLVRDEIYKMFRVGELFVSEQYEPGKRYRVGVDEIFIPERYENNRRMAKVSINCTIVGLPFAESAETSLSIQNRGVTDDGQWSYGMGLLEDPASRIYTYTSTSFNIYNPGTESVHPFFQELIITISQVAGSTSYFQLKNNTNGTSFKTNKAVSSSEIIVINGPQVTSNSLNYLRNTDRTFITLDPGWNSFTVTGATSAKIQIDSRFYYV